MRIFLKPAGNYYDASIFEAPFDAGTKDDINIVTLQGTIGASAQVGRTEGFGNILKQHDNWKC